MLISAASALSQATFRSQTRAAVHRTVFSMAVLVLTVQAVGLLYRQFGGVAGDPVPAVLMVAVIPMATAYFSINSGLVATAIALSGRERLWKVWARISDLAVVPYRQDQSSCLDFWGSDVRNHTMEGDTRWVNYNTSHFSSSSTVS